MQSPNYLSKLSDSKNKLEIPEEGPLSSEDQFFLYETVSVLIVSCNLQSILKAQLMKNLLAPTVSCFTVLIDKYLETNEEKLKLVYAKCLNSAMSVASRASKGFSNQRKVKDCECVEIFLEILRIFMPAINISTHKNLIHAGVRQYLHRMIVCLDNEVLEYLPLTIQHFIKISNEPKDLYDLMPLINQILNKYKQQIVPFMQIIMMELFNTILNFVNSMPLDSLQTSLLKVTPSQLIVAFASQTPSILPNVQIIQTSEEMSIDAQIILDAQSLYKSYFQFLLNIVNNDLMEIITRQQTNDVYKIFFTLIQGAQNGTLETIKCCFQIIRKFISVFGKYTFFRRFHCL